jgi:hypothetical protein
MIEQVEAPPLSASLGHFKAEATGRAAQLRQQRHRRVGGAVAGAMALLLAGSLAVHPGWWVQHTSTTASKPPGKASGLSPTSTDSESAGQAFSPVPARNAAPTSSNVYSIVNKPSGITASNLSTNMNLAVVLRAPAKGHWGTAFVSQGKGTVLTFLSQTEASGGGIRANFKATQPGTAKVTVPLIGRPPASWRATIIVSRTGAPACTPSGTCR